MPLGDKGCSHEIKRGFGEDLVDGGGEIPAHLDNIDDYLSKTDKNPLIDELKPYWEKKEIDLLKSYLELINDNISKDINMTLLIKALKKAPDNIEIEKIDNCSILKVLNMRRR